MRFNNTNPYNKKSQSESRNDFHCKVAMSYFYCFTFKPLSCMNFNNFFKCSIGFAIGKGRAVIRSNKRPADHD